LAVKRVRRNKSNCFQIIHDHKDSRSVTIDPRSMSGEYGNMIITFTLFRKNKHFLLCFFYLFITFQR